jgi:hypothetical protein
MSQYEPRTIPVFSDKDLQSLTSYVYRELQNISNAFVGVQAIQLQKMAVPPARLITGMIVLADGVHWNPGSGEGFYGYDGSKWLYLSFMPPITGITDGSDAPAGTVGEYLEVATSTFVGIGSNVTTDLASGTLQPGDWDIAGSAYFQASSSAGSDDLRAWINTVSATQPAGIHGGLGISSTTAGGLINTVNIPLLRLNISIPTTIYLSVNANYGSGTMQIRGFARARRVR